MNCLSNDFNWERYVGQQWSSQPKTADAHPKILKSRKIPSCFPNPLCGAKKYYTQQHFCQFVSYGNGVVAVADEKVYDFVCQYLQSCRYPFYAFDTPHLNQISKEMQKYQKAVCFWQNIFCLTPKGRLSPCLNLR